MRAAILGGSFNPTHVGHLVLAETVRVELCYDTIFFVPAFLPPHKTLAGGTSVDDRIAMLKKAIAGNTHFKIELCEIRRGGLSYTIETVTYLEKKLQAALDPLEGKIGVIIGDDLTEGFSLWKNALELSNRTNIILAHRLGTQFRKTAFNYSHTELSNAFLPISSSEIRRRIAEKNAFRYLVPQGVYRYITDRNLYEH